MEIIKSKNRVYIKNAEEKEVAYVSFPDVTATTVIIDHTFVDESLRGLKIASSLMLAAYQVIKENGKRANLSCSYAKHWFLSHPECQDILI